MAITNDAVYIVMKRIKFYVNIIAVIVTVYSCQKQVDLKATTTNANILVVEGLINVADSTKIKLSRTVVIGNKNTANPEGGATISIETAQAIVATLQERAKGTYITPVLNLDKTKQYRLRIKTADGKTYLSDLVDVKITTPIDSVGYNLKDNGIQLYVNSHDDTNNSRYYLYNYAETWRFDSYYLSTWVSNGYDIVPRSAAQMIKECFAGVNSSTIVLTSTAALSNDVVYQSPITFIDGTSEKLSVKYSILVTQTALTKEAYTFWDNLKGNTEQLGSIFDAQPSQLTGNIHNVNDASEPVIGYISAGTTQTKRIFITKSQLPSSFKTEYPYVCTIDSGDVADTRFALVPLNSVYVPLAPYGNDTYYYTDKPCGDCTIRGTTKQPAFWK